MIATRFLRYPLLLPIAALLVGFAWPEPVAAQGRSLRFFGHGTNAIDRVTVQIDPPVPVDVGGDFTIEFWMKASAAENASGAACTTGNDGWITSHIIIDRDVFGGGDFGDYGISLGSDGRLAFGVAIGGGGEGLCSSAAVNNGVWHHAAFTRAASGQMRIFIDGIERASGNGPVGDVSYRNGRGTSFTWDPYLVFGAEKHDAGGGFPSYSGLLDDVRISNSVRYTSNFTRPTTPHGAAGSVGLYRFDEGSGNCTGAILDSAPGGASPGECRFGGSAPAGPVYSTDTPFGGGPPPPPPPPPPCTFTLTPTMATVGPANGSGTVMVTAPAGCQWTATSNAAWVTVASGKSGTGDGGVTYAFAANTGPGQRVGTLTIGGTPFTLTQNGAADGDGDGLPDFWETQFGLNPNSASGNDGANGDPDGDGFTNLEELQNDSHPTATFARHLAEGATGSLFNLRIAVLNPATSGSAARVLLRFLKEGGTVATRFVSIGQTTRATIDAETVPGLAATGVSMVVESDRSVVVDRLMFWNDTGYGSHLETAAAGPSSSWFFAEGSTHDPFDLFLLLQNPSPTTTAQVEVRYLRPGGAQVIDRDYFVDPNSRLTIWVDQDSELAATDVSMAIDVLNGPPVIVERAMYRTPAGSPPFAAGHESAGVTSASTTWLLAEGATGPFFDLFLLLANATPVTANVNVTYLTTGGPVGPRPYQVNANSRRTIWVDTEPGLANAAVSMRVESSVPIVAERAMWWPGASGTWHEAHNSPGTTTTATRWGLAEGEEGGPFNAETYILIANTSPFPGSARVTLMFENGAPESEDVPLPASSRVNVPVRQMFGAVGRFGAVVQSLGGTPAQIVVERAIYWGAAWPAGANALAVPLP